jgi:hypothetical protein
MSAAVLAAGLAASVAQSVYSVNAVGYVNVTLVSGYNLLNNPLNGTNNQVSTILPTVPEGTALLKWDGNAQQFAQAHTYLGGVWYDENFAPSTLTINPGEGFFLQNNAGAVTITFVGEVPQGSLTNRVGVNYGFYGSIVPRSANLTSGPNSLGFPAGEGMAYNGWDKAAQSYAPAYTYLSGQWYDPNFSPADPVPAVAEGFLITNPGGAVDWTQTFSVNN